MQDTFLLLPDIEILFSHGKKYWDILFSHDMAFSEYGILGHSLDDLRDIMAKHMASCFLRLNQTHGSFPPSFGLSM